MQLPVGFCGMILPAFYGGTCETRGLEHFASLSGQPLATRRSRPLQ
jgi:hypothetical protein